MTYEFLIYLVFTSQLQCPLMVHPLLRKILDPCVQRNCTKICPCLWKLCMNKVPLCSSRKYPNIHASPIFFLRAFPTPLEIPIKLHRFFLICWSYGTPHHQEIPVSSGGGGGGVRIFSKTAHSKLTTQVWECNTHETVTSTHSPTTNE